MEQSAAGILPQLAHRTAAEAAQQFIADGAVGFSHIINQSAIAPEFNFCAYRCCHAANINGNHVHRNAANHAGLPAIDGNIILLEESTRVAVAIANLNNRQIHVLIGHKS